MPPPRTTTDEQYNMLLDYMEQHRDLVEESAERGASQIMWRGLADKLNRVGPPKDALWWRRHWAELKYRTKKKVILRKKGGTERPLTYFAPLLEVEERLLSFLGHEVPSRPDPSLTTSSSSMKRDASAPIHMKWDYNLKTKPIESLQIVNPLKDVKKDSDDAEHDGDEPEIEWSDAPQRLSTSDNEDNLNGTDDKHKSDVDSVLTWAHDIEKKRVENENKMAAALMTLAKSQAEMARAQQSMAKALHGIRRDVKIYLASKEAGNLE